VSWIHYIDNEVPDLAEWDLSYKTGDATIEPTPTAAWHERGGIGLEVHADAGETAFVIKSWTAPATCHVGFWMRYVAGDNASTFCYPMLLMTDDGTCLGWLQLRQDGNLIAVPIMGPGTAGTTLRKGRWYYIVVGVHAAAGDGWVRLYVDGQLRGESAGLNTAAYPFGRFSMGQCAASSGIDNLELHFDEVKVAASYPEPYVPTPADEYPSAERTVVLWRDNQWGGAPEFADYCVSRLGVPRANLIPLPTASADETLADYAAFASQVEDAVAAYFALNPTVADNCTCFLVGWSVPGAFMHGGIKHSAASRLMRYGRAFSSGAANPLYAPGTVERLTKTALDGRYLACRVDADTLDHAKAILDRAATVGALAELADADTLYGDDADYLASPACQRLRILTAPLTDEYTADAFIWGDAGTPAFAAGGTRAVFADTSAASADTLRATSSACGAALWTGGYAAALGSAETAESFDAESFFEMLRIGGTLAEAACVATAHLDYTAVPAGSPLMTAAFQRGGYNVYRGKGGIEQINWEQVVACARQDQQVLCFSEKLEPGELRVYGLRAVSRGGLEERNTHVVTYAQIDEDGGLLPAPLARVSDLTVTLQTSGDLVVGFSYWAPLGFAEAEAFDVLCDGGTGQLDLENPVATIDRAEDVHDFHVCLYRPESPVLMAVRARRDGQRGPVSRTVFVPAPETPAKPIVL